MKKKKEKETHIYDVKKRNERRNQIKVGTDDANDYQPKTN